MIIHRLSGVKWEPATVSPEYKFEITEIGFEWKRVSEKNRPESTPVRECTTFSHL